MSSDLQNLDTTSLAAQAAASASAEILQQAQSSSQVQPDSSQSQPQPQQPIVNGASEQLRCEWLNCPDTASGSRFSSADQLYVSFTELYTYQC